MNLLRGLAKKALLMVILIVHWFLDDGIPILPDSMVWTITGFLFQITGHGDRVDAFKKFWVELGG